MSIPYMPKKSFIYQAIICELTGLCEYAYDKISCCGVTSRFSLKRSVHDIYSLIQLIMVSFSLGSNEREHNFTKTIILVMCLLYSAYFAHLLNAFAHIRNIFLPVQSKENNF